MNGIFKKQAIALMTGAAVLCLGGALTCGLMPKEQPASAAVSFEAFIDIGANEAAKGIDNVLGLTETGATPTAAGTVTAGSTLFGSYATGATYTLTAAEGEHQIAVALKAEEGKTLKINNEAVSLGGKTGNTVITATKSGTSFEVTYDGALCGVLVAAKDSKVLMALDYAPGQVVSYGALLADELDDATAHYSDGTTAELEIAYSDINAGTGVNVNFTSVDVTGTIEVEGTQISVSRYVITMPDDLVYFINCGSYTVPDSTFSEPETVDGFYAYNQTIFDHYGEALLNNVPDRTTTQGGDWGIYTKHAHNAPGDASFPYNSMVWTGKSVGASDMGYMLSGLKPSESYRVWFGTLSHWHGRTSNITFNGEVVGSPTIAIPSNKSFTIFENIKPDANGKVDIHLTQIGSENEPTLCFIAVQPMSVEIPAAPDAPQGPTVVGMEDTSIALTHVSAGAKVQIYNAEKPNQLIYEEMVDSEKISSDGSYVLEWGSVLDISQFRVVQINAGGASAPLLVSVTDIKDFLAKILTDGYTTGNVTVHVEATADSGIANWSYRLGEYGETTTFDLDRPFKLDASFEAEQNGDYYIVVTSGLGVTYSEMIAVNTIDKAAPVISLLPSKDGWKSGKYNVALSVDSVAPVTSYRLLKEGKEVAHAETAPETIVFGDTGEYTVTVTTAAGQSSTANLRVSERPVSVVVRKSYDRRQLRYAFGDSADYVVYSVTAYQLLDGAISKMTIADGNMLDVYDPGTYVITALSKDGTVEMFALNVTKADFSAKDTGVVAFGGNGSVGLGVGLGVMFGGLALAAAGIALTLVLTKKKRS